MFKLVTISAATAALVGFAQAVVVNTPASLVQCQPTLLSWSDGVAPFYLAIIPGGQPSAAALVSLPTQQGTSYTWIVNLTPGQEVTVKITDSTGATNYSDKVAVQAGSSTTCASSSSSGAAAAPAVGSSSSSPSSSSRVASLSTSSATTALPTASAVMATAVKSSATSGIAAAGAAVSSSTTPSVASTTSKGSAVGSVKAASGLVLGVVAVVVALVA